MNTSQEDIVSADLIGTVSFKFSQNSTYQAAARLAKYAKIFPAGICIFYELQMDPLAM